MQLPSIHPTVPTSINPPLPRLAAARLTCLLLDAGVLHRRDLGGDSDDRLAVCERAMDRWLRSAAGTPLRHLVCAFELRAEMPPGEALRVTITWGAGWRGKDYIGPPIEALEAATPGLGATVLDLLASQSVHPLFTPVDALIHMIEHDWLGEDDESWALDAFCETEEERKLMAENMVTRAMFEDVFPDWVLAPLEARVLGNACLAEVAQRGGPAARVAQAVAAARDAIAEATARLGTVADLLQDDTRSEFLGWAEALRWRREDQVTPHVLGKIVETAQSAAHEHVGRVAIDPAQPAQLRRFLFAMRYHCRAVRALDHLIATLLAGE